MLQTGYLLDHKYRILSEIGHGGMSVVYMAINERANRTWAVKAVRKNGEAGFESVRQGLVVETEMLKKLRHPNLPGIIDVLDTEDSFLIVMDYIEGISLQKLLKTEGAQPEERVVHWGIQLCDVLGYLHRQDPPIIYRDMKPANVMLKPDGNVTLIDFGTAREFKNRAMAEDTTCLGTRGYAAPEQFGGHGQTDARTDIYCLGATLYHLLTGRSPAEPPYEIKPISSWIPQYAGSGLEKLILKCTRQDPADRYRNCEELMYALRHYRDEDDIEQKKRKKKWRAFLAGLIIGGIGLSGAGFSCLARNSALRQSYQGKIEAAMARDSIKDAKSCFLQALEVDAGNREAYDALLGKAEEDILLHNGRLTGETAAILNECLTKPSDGIVPNQDVLKAADPEAFAQIMNEIGLWRFFMMDNTDNNKKMASDSYFARIQDEKYLKYLPYGQRELAQLLYRIGGYIGKLNSRLSKYGSSTGTEGSYRTLFDDIAAIAGEDLKSRVEKDIYCVEIYKQIANWIDMKSEDFRGDGVTGAQMRDLLTAIEQGLESLNITESGSSYAEYLSAVDTVKTAEKTIGMERKAEEG